MGNRITRHTELQVYERAFELAMKLFGISASFPIEERYSMTDQARSASRSVCANLAEAWRNRRYKAAFVAKLSDSEAEAAETQVRLQFAVDCDYVPADDGRELFQKYDKMIVAMIHNPEKWLIK